MRLGKKQELFSELISLHVLWLIRRGYKVRTGDTFRDPRAHGKVGERGPYGKPFSMHKSKCAADLNLFKDGKYLTRTEDHAASGAKWESRHKLCFWGGRVEDGNHYSLSHRGRM